MEDERPHLGDLSEPSLRPAQASAHRVLELWTVRRQAGAGRLTSMRTSPPAPADPATLADRLGVDVDAELLERALTHRSYAYEHGGLPHNERLEFLGDSVLGVVITEALYRTHPDLPEGKLAKLRASVVNMRALAEIAQSIGGEAGLGAYVRLGRGEEATGGRAKASILADTLEAVIGAVYLQHGLVQAQQVIHDLFDPMLEAVANNGAGLDWKTSLQELTAGLGLGVPEYVISYVGPDHARTFTARASVNGEMFDPCEGRNKKEAEQAAAATAWKMLNARAADAEPDDRATS